MQETPYNDDFSPESIDEQIAQLIQEARDDRDKSRLLKDLQKAYQEEREEEQASERIHERLTRYVAERQSHGTYEEQRPVAVEDRSLQQGRKRSMETHEKSSRTYIKTRQFATIAAVLIAALLVGSLVVILNIARTHSNDSRMAAPVQQNHPTGAKKEQSASPEMYLGINNQVIKFDQKAKKVLWRFTIPSDSHAAIQPIVMQAPLVANGGVYFTGQDGKLYALNAQTGRQRWVQNFRYYISSQYSANGFLYVGVSSTSVNGAIYALNPTDGTIKKTYRAAGGIGEILGIFGSVMYFKNGADNILTALNLENDHPLWQTIFDAKQSLNGTVYVRKGVLYASSVHSSHKAANPPQDSYAYTLDIYSGKITWQSPMINGFFFNITVDNNGRIYFGAQNNYVYAFDPRANQQLWQYHVPDGNVYAAPIVQNDSIYVVQIGNNLNANYLTALDVTTGSLKWAKVLDEYSESDDNEGREQPVLYNDVIYLTTLSGVHGFTVTNGDDVVTIPAKTLQSNIPESSMALTLVSITIV